MAFGSMYAEWYLDALKEEGICPVHDEPTDECDCDTIEIESKLT